MNTPGILRSVPRGKSAAGGPSGDHDILAGCRQGDRAAWRALYDRYSAIVYRFLAAFGVPPEEREDACQEVFVAVYRSLAHFRGEARLSTWIYRIAARHSARAGRRRRVRSLLSNLLLREPPPPPVAPIPRRRANGCACSTSWSASCRRRRGSCWCCSRSKGCRSRRSRKIAECPENTAWSRLHYARAELMAMARKRAQVTERDVSQRSWPTGTIRSPSSCGARSTRRSCVVRTT